MSDHAPEVIGQEPDPHFVAHAREHLKLYFTIGAILIVCTLATIGLAKIEMFDFGVVGVTPSDLVVGLALASLKSSLVILIFMHMKGEKLVIFKFLIFTIVFVIGMVWLILMAQADPITFEDFSRDELFIEGA